MFFSIPRIFLVFSTNMIKISITIDDAKPRHKTMWWIMYKNMRDMLELYHPWG